MTQGDLAHFGRDRRHIFRTDGTQSARGGALPRAFLMAPASQFKVVGPFAVKPARCAHESGTPVGDAGVGGVRALWAAGDFAHGKTMHGRVLHECGRSGCVTERSMSLPPAWLRRRKGACAAWTLSRKRRDENSSLGPVAIGNRCGTGRMDGMLNAVPAAIYCRARDAGSRPHFPPRFRGPGTETAIAPGPRQCRGPRRRPDAPR